MTGRKVAAKIMENIGDNIEEIDEEYLVYRDLCLHPNIPSFYGVFFKPGKRREDDQLWFVMEVSLSFIHLLVSIHFLSTGVSFKCIFILGEILGGNHI
jgi:serine/threonine protein kinase